ncbi:hypothetical protein OHA21_08780 [Actinoplanes sp. NBC_00393]|uniref:BTAD domain-containing putative transcriptional regulator n=1 Tax=Actinoplanes sp. NBC_00393 TaxID=2975953 RepID=UPI002E24D5D9
MLQVAVLGPADLRRDGVRLALPAGRTTELLVRLALDAGTLVRTDRLIDDLWSGPAAGVARNTGQSVGVARNSRQSVGVARNTLQSKVSQLRRAVGDPGLVTGGPDGYRLNVDPRQVDALEVLRLADETAALRSSDDTVAAAATAAAALARFTGLRHVSAEGLLPSGGDGDWLIAYRSRLHDCWLRLTGIHLAARLDLGGEVTGELEVLTASHPLHEAFWVLLVTALYRAGRQADALSAYHRVWERLDHELGVEPGPALQELHQRILRHDPGLAAPRHRGNLPAPGPPLVGRDSDLADLGRLLAAHRLVTVVGPAGVGKTRLALTAAARRRDPGGAWLVRLDSTPADAPLWPAVGEAFGLTDADEAAVLDRLRGAGPLLLLDNCEHLVEAAADLAERLPHVRILATSRAPLGVDGEAVHPLEPLSAADSAALFRERASRQRPSFEASDATVTAICRDLDGLPLAIELAAARARVLPIGEIARRLDDRFTLLADPNSRRPARLRTLRAAIAWSYDLLSPTDRAGLWALSCFSGSAPLDAVEEVLQALDVPPATAPDVIGRLVDHSMVAVDTGPGDMVRYRLLDSVRDFSREELAATTRSGTAYAAHAAWFAAAADRARAGLHSHGQATHLRLARVERANIEAALTWAGVHDPGLGLRITNGFGWAWIMLGAGAEAARRSRAALTAAGPQAPVPQRVTALLFTGWFEAAGGDLEQAAADVDEACALAGDEELRARGQLFRAFVHTQAGRPEAALAALRTHRDVLHGWEQGAACLLTAWSEIALGRVDRGRTACDEAIQVLTRHGDAWALCHAEAILGGLAQARHRFTDATVHLRRAAAAAHELGFAAAEALHLANLGRAHQQAGDGDTAASTLAAAVETALTVGDLRTVALARVRLARVLRAQGRDAEAHAEVSAARDWFLSAGGGDGALLAQHLAAALAGSPPEPAASDQSGPFPSLTEVLGAAAAAGDREVELLTLDLLAARYAEIGDHTAARDFLGRADQLLPAVRHLLTDGDRIDAARARTHLAGTA